MECEYCKIVANGHLKKFWSDDNHIAFISPNEESFATVITKKHYPNNNIPTESFKELIRVTTRVAEMILYNMGEVARTNLYFDSETTGHSHADLIAVHTP